MANALLLMLVPCVHSKSPEQVHISLGGIGQNADPNGMYISWFTQEQTETSTVQYGTTSGVLTQSAYSVEPAQQYLTGHGYHHTVLLQDLPASTRYFYRVGDHKAGFSGEFSFVSALAKDDASEGFNMSIFGDMGYEDSKARPMEITVDGLVKDWSATYSRQILESMKNEGSIDMVWHLGDIGYLDDSYSHGVLKFSYESAYNGYMNWLQNITSVMPYMVSPGNHESECHSPSCVLTERYGQSLRNFTAFNTRWRMPSRESNGHPKSNMWYSWNYGAAHFVSLNTETDFPGAGESNTGDSHIKKFPAGHFGREGEYLAWLEADLKLADAARRNGTGREWLIAGGHRPYDEIKHIVEDLFEKYGVDIYFAGHSHSYSRSLPSVAGRVETNHSNTHYQAPSAPTWVTVGGAGCEEMSQGKDIADGERVQGYTMPHGAGVVHTDRYATGVLSVTPEKLHWRLIDSVDGSILDSFQITK